MFPVALDVPGTTGAMRPEVGQGAAARAFPGSGLGLRRPALPDRCRLPAAAPQVSFNYLGQFDWASTPDGGLWRGVRGGLGADVSPGSEPAAPAGRGRPGGGRAAGVHLVLLRGPAPARARSRALAEELRCRAARDRRALRARPGAGGRTPSDFPLAGLDQAAVDRLVGDGRSVEDIYPLTPMQAGMVFHGLSQRDQGVYFEQVDVRPGRRPRSARARRGLAARGGPDPGAAQPGRLRRWHRASSGRAAARSTVPVTYLDWTGLTEAQRHGELARLRAATGRPAWTSTAAPLLRVALARLSGDEVQVLWTFHHVLLDGWSVFQVLADVFDCHAALAAGQCRRSADAAPFRGLPARGWPAGPREAEAYWRRVLAGFDAPTPLPYDRPPARNARRSLVAVATPISRRVGPAGRVRPAAPADPQHPGPGRLGAAAVPLQRAARRLLRRHGVRPAGRPARRRRHRRHLHQHPAGTGAGGRRLPAWPTGSQRLQASQAEARRFDYVSLAQLRSWSDLPAGLELFDSLVVFENYPINAAAAEANGLRVRGLQAFETTNYPLTVVVSPGPRLSIEARLRPGTVRPVHRGTDGRPPGAPAARPGRGPAGAAGRRATCCRRPSATRCWCEWNDTRRAIAPRHARRPVRGAGRPVAARAGGDLREWRAELRASWTAGPTGWPTC